MPSIQEWIIRVGAFIAFITGIFFTGKAIGKKDKEIEQMEESFRSAKDAKQDMEELAASDDIDAKLKRLHENG